MIRQNKRSEIANDKTNFDVGTLLIDSVLKRILLMRLNPGIFLQLRVTIFEEILEFKNNQYTLCARRIDTFFK